jgi:hypothetical protein
MEITDEARQKIVRASIAFLTDVSNAIDDSDLALSMFEKLGEVIDPNLKGEVLLAMLTGSVSNRAYISTTGFDLSNKVACIKAIRVATGFGLKEAKDFVDGMYQHKEYKLELINDPQAARRELIQAGFIVR